jgi:hypothetical protein
MTLLLGSHLLELSYAAIDPIHLGSSNFWGQFKPAAVQLEDLSSTVSLDV